MYMDLKEHGSEGPGTQHQERDTDQILRQKNRCSNNSKMAQTLSYSHNDIQWRPNIRKVSSFQRGVPIPLWSSINSLTSWKNAERKKTTRRASPLCQPRVLRGWYTCLHVHATCMCRATLVRHGGRCGSNRLLCTGIPDCVCVCVCVCMYMCTVLPSGAQGYSTSSRTAE